MKSFLVIIVLALSSLNLYSEKGWVKLGEVAEEPSFRQLTCIDSNNCFTSLVSADKFYIYKSTDMGVNWIEIYSKIVSNNYFTYHTVIDNENMHFISNKILYKSTNGGISFDSVDIDKIIGSPSTFYFNYKMFDNNLGVGITTQDLYLTTDNWKNFKSIPKPDSIRTGIPPIFLDSNNLLFYKEASESIEFMQFTIPSISFYKYSILENEWTLYNQNSTTEPHSKNLISIRNITIYEDGVIFACGSKGFQHSIINDIILKSIDQGKTWKKLLDKESDLAGELIQISFKDENHGIAVGKWGKILETTDGGLSWFQYPLQTELMCTYPIITWAGDTPLFGASEYGVYSLQTLSGIEELNSNEKFKVYQSGNHLEIAINDPSNSTYNYKLYTSSGKSLMTQDIGSTYGFVFEPVELIDLSNGIYFYTITKNNTVEFTGKLILVE